MISKESSGLKEIICLGDENIADILIKNGTNVNLQDNGGKTALHLATQRGNQ